MELSLLLNLVCLRYIQYKIHHLTLKIVKLTRFVPRPYGRRFFAEALSPDGRESVGP